jgi:phosphate uptake regulator
MSNFWFLSCFADQRRQVQAHLSELQVSLASSSAAQSELREAMEAFRMKAESYRVKLEAAEIEKVKISRAEALRALLSYLRNHHHLLSVLPQYGNL